MAHVGEQHAGTDLLARREWFQVAAGAVAGGGAMTLARGDAPAPCRSGSATIRVGLIGCGGRGTGAALQAVAADPAVRVVALGDAFDDQLASAAHVLTRDARAGFDCPGGRRFSGPDAFRRVLDVGVDAVVIAAPPHLRPRHVEAAVAAGCHVFCETPAAVDAAGARRVWAALSRAAASGRSVASGLHARRDVVLMADVAQVRSGTIGAPRVVEVRAGIGAPWRVSAPAGSTAAEVRLRNWISCDACSGGRFVEHHVHAVDRALWALGDRVPAVAEPLRRLAGGGVAVRYGFDDGAEVHAALTEGAATPRCETVSGARGVLELRLAADGRRFQATMDAFIHGIRSARPIDDGLILVQATVVAIMGRLAAITERSVAWDEMVSVEGPVFPGHQIVRGVNIVGV